MKQSQLIVRSLLNPWVIGGAFLLATTLTCITLSLLWITRPASSPSGGATAVFNIIPMPTYTRTIPPSTPTIPQTPALDLPPSPPPGAIAPGAYVQISGTGGDGLRLRSQPGLEGQVNFLALEAEVFQVDGGPQEKDGYTWWHLVAPYDNQVQGWAVANYLLVVQKP